MRHLLDTPHSEALTFTLFKPELTIDRARQCIMQNLFGTRFLKDSSLKSFRLPLTAIRELANKNKLSIVKTFFNPL